MKFRILSIFALLLSVFVSCEEEQEVVIEPSLSVSATTGKIEAEGGSFSFEVTSNVEWTVTLDQDWASVSPSGGSGSESAVTVTVSADANDSESARPVTVTVKADTRIKSFSILQLGKEPASLEVSAETFSVECEGGDVDFTVTGNVPWRAESDSEWVTVTPASGDASDDPSKVVLSVSANGQPVERTASVTVSSGDIVRTVSVVQAGVPASMEVSVSELKVDAEGGDVDFTVTSNVSWTAESDSDWATVSPASGEGSDKSVKVVLSASVNEQAEERTATVTVTAGEIVRTVTLVQGPAPLAFQLNVGEAEITPSDVAVSLSSDEASKIYYAFVSTSAAKRFRDEASRSAYLLASGKCVEGTSAKAYASEFDDLSLAPNTTVVFFAMGVDAEGNNGKVYYAEYTTIELKYNDIVVTAEVLGRDPGECAVAVSAEGGDVKQYIYWVGTKDDNFWTSTSNGLGQSVENATKFMSENPNHSRIVSVTEAYPVVDGQILMPDLKTGKETVFVVMAIAADGSFSNATIVEFKTRAYKMGTIVTAKNADGSDNAQWAAVTPNIEWIESAFSRPSGMISGSYAFNITIAEGYTAYVLAGTDYYFGSAYKPAEIEDNIATIVKWTDKVRDWEYCYDNEAFKNEGYPAGHYLYHSPHGVPSYGYGVLFPETPEEHAANCTNPKCTGYTGTREILIYYNDGTPVRFFMGDASGNNIDKVFVTLKDKDGNFYEPYRIDVPDELF